MTMQMKALQLCFPVSLSVQIFFSFCKQNLVGLTVSMLPTLEKLAKSKGLLT